MMRSGGPVVLAMLVAVGSAGGFAAEVPSAADAPEIAHDEEVVAVPTTRLISEELLKGEDYSVDHEVSIYRARAFYEGEFAGVAAVVVGTRQLHERIDEVTAVRTLRAMKKTSVYKDALKNSALGPVRLGKSMVQQPVDTVKNVGRGIGNFFADIGYSIVSDDPNQENVAKTAVGFATAKRALAFEMGVNPYTDFKVLEDELNEVAWTSVGGGLTVTAGFRAVGGAASTALSATKTANGMRQLVRDNSPRKLQNINADKLKSMGIKEELAEALLDNYNYDPETETRLVGALDSMRGVAGRELFVQRAVLADTRANARLVRDWAELFAAYHSEVAPAKGIAVSQTAPLLVLDDSVLALFPADYVMNAGGFVLDQLREITDELTGRGLTPGSFWVTGPMDPAVASAIEGLGWAEVRSNVEDVLYTE